MRNGPWSGARSAVRTLQHGIISAAALGPPPGLATRHIATRLIIHAIVTPSQRVDAARLPNTARCGCATRSPYSIHLRRTQCDVIRGASSRLRAHCPHFASAQTMQRALCHCHCIRFKTKTILQAMFTLAFSQAAQCSVSKRSSTCVIATPIKRTVSLPVRF